MKRLIYIYSHALNFLSFIRLMAYKVYCLYGTQVSFTATVRSKPHYATAPIISFTLVEYI
jgi:hypothetical protein